MLTKQEILLGRAPGWRAVGYGDPEELLCRMAQVSGFMVMALVFGWSLASYYN